MVSVLGKSRLADILFPLTQWKDAQLGYMSFAGTGVTLTKWALLSRMEKIPRFQYQDFTDFSPVEELRLAMQLFCICVRLAAVGICLTNNQKHRINKYPVFFDYLQNGLSM